MGVQLRDDCLVYIGQVICRGPSNVVVLLTEPFNSACLIVEILDDIQLIARTASLCFKR